MKHAPMQMQYRYAVIYETPSSSYTITARENLYNREGPTDSTPVGKYDYTWTTKGLRYYPQFQFYRAFIEGLYIWLLPNVT